MRPADWLQAVPIYQQIRDRIVEAIGRGGLRRGDALASVRQLAGAFAINPATVAKAYDLLRAEGLVATNAKSGSFVADDRDTSVPTDSPSVPTSPVASPRCSQRAGRVASRTPSCDPLPTASPTPSSTQSRRIDEPRVRHHDAVLAVRRRLA